MLKDKLDELMRQFLSLMEEVKTLRRRVTRQVLEAQRVFLSAYSLAASEDMREALMLPRMKVEITERTEQVMNLRIPRYTLQAEGDPFCYGMVNTPLSLDKALRMYQDLLPSLIQLAEREKEMAMLSSEIDRTRRRVNALEYILIPNLTETIRYIVIKLEELERSNLTRLMKIKEIVRQH